MNLVNILSIIKYFKQKKKLIKLIYIYLKKKVKEFKVALK